MPELVMQRTDDVLTIRLGEHSAAVPWAALAPDATTGQRIYDDASTYGKDLFEKTFPAGPLRAALTSLPTNERLVLVIDDPLVATLPWEYLRDPEGRLLAGRLNLVRSVPGARQNAALGFSLPLHIVAVPVSPVDDARVLDTEGEWQHVVDAVSQQGKALTLTRVRPPTIDRLERTLNSERTTLVHFMGHSNSRDGKGLLVFEEAHGRSYLVEAADFADSLVATSIFLVVLNSCRSAVAWDWTAFGNIARGLVREGVPYALGMQFVLPDAAALAMSQAFYDFLLQGRGVEEAVRRTRRALERDTDLHNPAWLAGISVLYTSLREQPAAPLKLQPGQPAIQPDPERLQKTCDLTALPRATHFVGRGKEISEVLDALLASRPADFVVLHGLGGIGKTSVALAAAERIGWHYDDRVLALTFETLARLDASDQRVVDDTFADRFYNRLARFYELDPADSVRYPSTIDLQQAILQRRAHTRSLLVFDNIETLIDTQKDHPVARSLATFISRLKEGNGAILLTSRMLPPADWGACQVIELPGLEDSAGADLFLALLPADREHLAPRAERLALSRRVQGHPLSIRLLAGRFAETTGDLGTFLNQSETELEVAEQATPTSLEDPERQRTLYACMDYSIRRLTLEQRVALDAVSLFQAPFPPEFAAHVLNDEQQSPLHLQNLVRLGLLSATLRTFKEGELLLLDLHPMLRWYIEHHLSERDAALQERYGEVYENLARQSYQPEGGYDQSSRMRYLLRQSLPDCEAALQYLPSVGRGSLAYLLGRPYQRLGQNRRALALYELALQVYQELGDLREVAVTQSAMAGVLQQQGKPQEAMALYEQALRTKQELGDVRSVAVTQHAMAEVLSQQGKPQEAMALYEQALRTKQELGDLREVAVTQANFCQLLFQQGEHRRALLMAWDACTSLREHGYSYDAQEVQQVLISIKGQVLGPEEFDRLWQQVMSEPQPDWLRDVQASVSPEQDQISQEQLEVIISNTITVMTTVLEKRDEWRNVVSDLLKQAQSRNQVQITEFFTAILAILDSQIPSLPGDHPYAGAINAIQAGIAAGGTEDGTSSITVSDELMQAVRDFVNADDWDASRQVVEARQALLFQPEVETLFEQNIARARSAGEERAVEMLELHLALLRDCRADGIAEAFAKLAADQESDLPFDTELLPRSIAALLGSPQEKMEHMQYLTALAGETADADLKALINTIQLALFSKDLSQFGRELTGIYRQAWEAIVTTVEAGGVDPETFDTIINNSLAVLGPVPDRRSEWRGNLVTLRNQATAAGNRNMAALLEAVIGLLDAGGDPSGLGEGLAGVYAKTWQAIVGQLPG